MSLEEGSNGTESVLDLLNTEIIQCRRCPRLVAWREQVAMEKRAAFRDEDYWGKPVPNFGDPTACRLIVGLAPAAHGGNRTGRLFTGDRSGDWLFQALYNCGVANQPGSTGQDDGLTLSGVYMTPAVHCAPPDNKPTPDEFKACSGYLDALLADREWLAILCLGSLAWHAAHRALGRKMPRFAHQAVSEASGGATLIGCYHPSQQNTFTGRLTMPMLEAAIRDFLAQPRSPR